MRYIYILPLIICFISYAYGEETTEQKASETKDTVELNADKPIPPVKEVTLEDALSNIQIYDKEDFNKPEYRKLIAALEKYYIPEVVLTNLAKDMGYHEKDKNLFLNAINSLKRDELETLLWFYDNRKYSVYKKLINRIKKTKRERKDIPPTRIIKDNIEYRYSKLKASKREKILLRISERVDKNKVVKKDLSTYSLDELLKEIEARGWEIKLQRHPNYLKKSKKPVF